jgi:hypothetical protein
MSKESLTVVLCGNVAGEMEKPLLNLKINNLPVICRNNKKL